MSVYDRAYELAGTLKVCEEYKQYMIAKEKLQSDEQNAKLLQDFRRRQMEVLVAEMSGEGEENEHNVEQLEKMYQMISSNPVINEFLTAEYRLSRMMTDVQKIIGEALDLWTDTDPKRKLMN